MRAVRIFLMAAVGVCLFVPAAYAHDAKPDCHGANQLPCRPDPQPTHGNDCTHSDDHVCEVPASTTTSTTQPPATTTTSRPTPTTTTTTPAPSPSPTTSTTQASPTTSTAPPVVSSASPSVVAPTALVATDDGRQLAATGAGSKALALLGMWFVISGALAIVIGKLIKGGR